MKENQLQSLTNTNAAQLFDHQGAQKSKFIIGDVFCKS